MLDAALSPVFVAFFSDVAQPRLHPPVIPRQEVGDIIGVIPTSLIDSDKLMLFDAAVSVALMRPTEPGATGHATRGSSMSFLSGQLSLRDQRSWRLDWGFRSSSYRGEIGAVLYGETP